MAEVTQAGANANKSQVEVELNRLNNTVGQQQALVAGLDTALLAVSRTISVTPDTADVKEEELVPAANSIRELRFMVESNNRHIKDITSRLEV